MPENIHSSSRKTQCLYPFLPEFAESWTRFLKNQRQDNNSQEANHELIPQQVIYPLCSLACFHQTSSF